MTVRVACPGSFDPVTLGHLDVIGRAAALFDEVVVAVGANPGKAASRSQLFTPAERVDLLTAALADHPSVRVTLFDGLLVDFCTRERITAVVKGLRRAGDVDHELPMAQMNAHLSGLETVLLPTAPAWAFVSSSLVREVARMDGDVAAFLPPAVATATLARVREQRTD